MCCIGLFSFFLFLFFSDQHGQRLHVLYVFFLSFIYFLFFSDQNGQRIHVLHRSKLSTILKSALCSEFCIGSIQGL
jgi:uncharacterized membrane protein